MEAGGITVGDASRFLGAEIAHQQGRVGRLSRVERATLLGLCALQVFSVYRAVQAFRSVQRVPLVVWTSLACIAPSAAMFYSMLVVPAGKKEHIAKCRELSREINGFKSQPLTPSKARLLFDLLTGERRQEILSAASSWQMEGTGMTVAKARQLLLQEIRDARVSVARKRVERVGSWAFLAVSIYSGYRFGCGSGIAGLVWAASSRGYWVLGYKRPRERQNRIDQCQERQRIVTESGLSDQHVLNWATTMLVADALSPARVPETVKRLRVGMR